MSVTRTVTVAAGLAPAGDVVALVMSTDTMALLLEAGGKVIRELNRSYYHAGAYRYPLGETAGDLLPIGDSILALYQCPRPYNAATGDLQAEWTGLPTGQADSPIVGGTAFSGPARVAIDERHQRFAVAGETGSPSSSSAKAAGLRTG